APVSAQSPEQAKATVAYLRALQTDIGGFTARAASPAGEKSNEPSLRATSSTLRALKYFGGEPKNREAAKRFVARCFDKASRVFSDNPGTKPDFTSTAVGLMALVELKMPIDDYREPAVKYLAANAKTFEDIRIAAAGLEAVGKRPPQADDWVKQVNALRGAKG